MVGVVIIALAGVSFLLADSAEGWFEACRGNEGACWARDGSDMVVGTWWYFELRKRKSWSWSAVLVRTIATTDSLCTQRQLRSELASKHTCKMHDGRSGSTVM